MSLVIVTVVVTVHCNLNLNNSAESFKVSRASFGTSQNTFVEPHKFHFEIIINHGSYRKDMRDSRLHFFQDDPFLERMFPCCTSYIQFSPFRLDKNFLK